MLPGIACAVTGGCSHRKELFFYGAVCIQLHCLRTWRGCVLPNVVHDFRQPFRTHRVQQGYGDYFKVGLAGLHGPELPLELFVKEERRPATMKGRDWCASLSVWLQAPVLQSDRLSALATNWQGLLPCEADGRVLLSQPVHPFA